PRPAPSAARRSRPLTGTGAPGSRDRPSRYAPTAKNSPTSGISASSGTSPAIDCGAYRPVRPPATVHTPPISMAALTSNDRSTASQPYPVAAIPAASATAAVAGSAPASPARSAAAATTGTATRRTAGATARPTTAIPRARAPGTQSTGG